MNINKEMTPFKIPPHMLKPKREKRKRETPKIYVIIKHEVYKIYKTIKGYVWLQQLERYYHNFIFDTIDDFEYLILRKDLFKQLTQYTEAEIEAFNGNTFEEPQTRVNYKYIRENKDKIPFMYGHNH